MAHTLTIEQKDNKWYCTMNYDWAIHHTGILASTGIGDSPAEALRNLSTQVFGTFSSIRTKEEKIAEWNKLKELDNNPANKNIVIEHIAEHSPVGLKPKKLWLEERLQEINEVIVRYAAARMVIPVEWLNEYLQISNELNGMLRGSVSINALRKQCGLPPLTEEDPVIK